MSKRILSSIALSTAILGGIAGTGYDYGYGYSGSFNSERVVPNWQKINNFNPKPIKHINHKRKQTKRRNVHL